MIKVFGLARSGTAWAANWLGLIHDPLERYSVAETLQMPGVACTTSWLFPRLRAQMEGPTVVLHRPLTEVNASLVAIGLPTLPEWIEDALYGVDGEHFDWQQLWVNPEPIWNILRPDAPFDPARHRELSRVIVETDMKQWNPQQATLEELKDWV